MSERPDYRRNGFIFLGGCMFVAVVAYFGLTNPQNNPGNQQAAASNVVEPQSSDNAMSQPMDSATAQVAAGPISAERGPLEKQFAAAEASQGGNQQCGPGFYYFRGAADKKPFMLKLSDDATSIVQYDGHSTELQYAGPADMVINIYSADGSQDSKPQYRWICPTNGQLLLRRDDDALVELTKTNHDYSVDWTKPRTSRPIQGSIDGNTPEDLRQALGATPDEWNNSTSVDDMVRKMNQRLSNEN
jgi:hypothetical protein